MGIAGYASSVALGSASGNAGSNSIYLTKVVLPRNTTIGADAILLGVATAASGIQLKGLVYDNTGTSGSPGALKASSSVVTSAASPMTTLSFSSPVSLAAGTYYVGYVCNSTLSVDIDSSQTGSSWFVNGGQSVSSPANPLSGGSSQNNALSVALRYDSGSTLTGWMTDYSPGITLSSSNDVATHDSVNQIESCRSGVGNTSTAGGLYYAEVKVNSIGSNCRVGLGAAAFALDNATVLGAEYGTAGLDNTGTIHLPGSPFTVSIGLSYTSGDTIGLAYDANHSLLWFNKNGGSWYGGSNVAGDPTAGTSGNGLTNIVSSWPLHITVQDKANGAYFTLHDENGQFIYSPPSGYSSWSGLTAGGFDPAKFFLAL